MIDLYNGKRRVTFDTSENPPDCESTCLTVTPNDAGPCNAWTAGPAAAVQSMTSYTPGRGEKLSACAVFFADAMCASQS